MVVMGESNAYGMSASSSKNEWVQVLGDHIRDFQDGPMRLFNNSIPANVISPDAPGYEPTDRFRTAPSALERFETDMIGYRPDMAVYAYGLNDSRCGHSEASFMKAYSRIVSATRKSLPDSLIVLVGPYWNLQYDSDTWADPQNRVGFGKFGLPGDDLVLAYNEAISRLAKETGSLFVNAYRALEGASWLLTADACHFSDIGQRIIGLLAFCEIATRCSFLTHTSRRMEQELGTGIRTTGGTNALPEVIQAWRQPDTWKT